MSWKTSVYDNFRNEILSKSLPKLIDCVNLNYGLSLSLDELDISFNPSRKSSTAYGSNKIVFGEIRAQYVASTPKRVRNGEYLMFKNDLDLWTHDVFGWEFVAWWLPAHELAHIVTSIFRGICNGISEPIIPNTLKKISSMKGSKPISIGDFPLLEDLLLNQAYWIRQGSVEEGRRNILSSVYNRNTYTISHLNSNTSIFSHGVFFQHIYRTLRRQIVNPKFNIPVSNWKQKAKPKRKTRVSRSRGRRGFHPRYRSKFNTEPQIPEPQMY